MVEFELRTEEAIQANIKEISQELSELHDNPQPDNSEWCESVAECESFLDDLATELLVTKKNKK